MKKVLLASTALVMSAGFAAADVSVGGDGRMGIIDAQGADDIGFTSRIRISFSASGETDAGLAFGGSVRADNSGGGAAGTAGSVFIEGTFGKISMGDVSGAAEAAVGDLSGVGLTNPIESNALVYLSNVNRPAARWDYTVADFGVHVSADKPAVGFDAHSLAITYSMGDISFGLGYEDADIVAGTAILGTTLTADASADHIIGSVTAGFGDATVKVAYGTADIDVAGTTVDFTQAGASVDFVSGATTFTAYYVNYEFESGGASTDLDGYGVGVAYDLGGGASIKAGYESFDDGVATTDDDAFDLGISMSF